MNKKQEGIGEKFLVEAQEAIRNHLQNLNPRNSPNNSKPSVDITPADELIDFELETKVGAQINPSGVQMNVNANGHGKLSWPSLRVLLWFLNKNKENKD